MRLKCLRACAWVKKPADDALRHRQERVSEPGLLVAWMKQEFRLAALRPEHAIAGDDPIANEIGVEVLAHRRGSASNSLACLARASPGAGSRHSGEAARRAARPSSC